MADDKIFDGQVYDELGRLIALEVCPKCGKNDPDCPLPVEEVCPYDA